MNCSPPGSSVHGILQARMLEWVAIPFSRGSSQPRDWTQVICIAGSFFTVWATQLMEKYKSKSQQDVTLHLSEWLSSKRQKNITNVVKDTEKRGPLCIVDKNVNWCSHYEKPYGIPQKIENRTTIQSSYPTSVFYPKNMKTEVQKDTCTPIYVYHSPVYNSQDTRAI